MPLTILASKFNPSRNAFKQFDNEYPKGLKWKKNTNRINVMNTNKVMAVKNIHLTSLGKLEVFMEQLNIFERCILKSNYAYNEQM
jgi:hypothetical protein